MYKLQLRTKVTGEEHDKLHCPSFTKFYIENIWSFDVEINLRWLLEHLAINDILFVFAVVCKREMLARMKTESNLRIPRIQR